MTLLMKKGLLFIALLTLVNLSIAQENISYWSSTVKRSNAVTVENKKALSKIKLFALDIDYLKSILVSAPKKGSLIASNVIVSFPDADGEFEKFSVLENSNMDPELEAKYPGINSYVGQGIDDPTAIIYFSVSPLGLQTMLIRANKSAVFIEPYTTDQSSYVVYRKSDKMTNLQPFECAVIAAVNSGVPSTARPNADDGFLRNFRLALSVTGEYTAFFGGTKPLALAGINASMTRVNGVFEIDLGIHMTLIANNDLVIYTNAATDPYSAAGAGAGGAWNQELQTTLTNVIGSAFYDVGHLFGASGGGGNAGCIACVCVNPTGGAPLGKGSAFTSPADAIPQGDNFDIDYVAHEFGHQFGGNHTFTFNNEGTGVQMEPGSGNTIMGYAGITGSTDVQAHSDAYFHAISIQQITNYVKVTTCQTNTATGNAIPTANAGLDYTTPKGTPFMLTGSGTDANGDILTYCWEQMNSGAPATTFPSVTATSGTAFKSFLPSTNPIRYFPQLSTVKTGATSWTWEAVPNVARTMSFRFTVRDNRAGGPANNSDDMIVTFNATAGPFAVTAPNTAVNWANGSTQTVTWNVSGTTANGVNTANVDILLSTDGGNTYPITVLAATPNDGTQTITVPNNPGTLNRIMVKGTNHIFFDISNINFTISGAPDSQAPSNPTNLAASGTTITSTNLTWTASTDNVAVTGYDVYKDAVFLTTVATTLYNVVGLTPSTPYAFFVKARDAVGNISGSSNVVNIVTLTPCLPENPVSVSIASNPSGTVCTGTNVIFTATPTNPGTTPIYQWKKNGTSVGINSATYSDNSLTTGNQITCILTSNVSCPTGNPATSNTITMTINSLIDDNNICTTDACNTLTGVITNSPVNVDDGNACTVDGCDSGGMGSIDLLSTNDFSFSGLLSANGWVAHSGVGTNSISTTTGLTYSGFLGSGIGNAALVNNLNGEDVNKTFTSQNTNGQSIYYSCLVRVTEAANKSGEYFLHIGTPGGASFSAFAARVFAKVTAGVVNFGLSNSSTVTYGTTPFATNITYLLVVKYTIVAGTGSDPTSLWVITSGVPASEVAAGSPEVANTTTNGVDAVNTIALRQATNTPQTVVDGIRVGPSWSSVLIAQAGAGIFHNPVNVDDGNACTTDGCNSTTGIFHTPVSTDDGDACTTDLCNTSSGAITHDPISVDDGIACTIDGCNTLTGVFHTPVNCGVEFTSNILLEGSYTSGGLMSNCLFITGVSSNPMDADLLTISAMDPTFPYALVDAQIDTAKTNGNINFSFGPAVIAGNNYFLKVNHRNSIETWSAAPVTLTATTTYLFSSALTQAYLSNQGTSPDNMGFVIYTGDINQDLTVDATDFLFLDPSIQNGDFGYFDGDLNGDGAVDASDFLVLEPNINLGIGAAIP